MNVAFAGLPAENFEEKNCCASNRLDFLAPPLEPALSEAKG